MKKIILCWLICFSAILSVIGADPVIPLKRDLPVIDGKPGDACWKTLPWNSGFSKCGSSAPAAVQTRFKAFHNGYTLYLLIEADEPDMGKIKARPYNRDSHLIWSNDSVEISLVKDPKVLSFYKYIVDCHGIFSDVKCIDDNTNSDRFNTDYSWNTPAEIRASRGTDRWWVEAAIPFGSMDFQTEGRLGWRLNVARSRFAGGKVELSSWSVTPKVSHMLPKSFKQVHFEDFDPRNFYFEFENCKYTFIREKNGKYVLTGSATIHNQTGSNKIMNLRISQNSKPERSAMERKLIPAHRFMPFSVELKDALPGEYLVTFAIYSNNSVPVLLKQHTQKINLEYRSLAIKLKRPCYRNNIYATMPDKTIEAVIELKEGTGNPVTIELVGKNFRQTRSFKTAADVNRVIFDGSKLKDGEYFLRASSTCQGRKLTDEVRIRKLPRLDGEVWLDKDGITYVNGEKFFPFGWYGTHGEASPWLNSTLFLNSFANPKSARKCIANNFKYGLRTMILPFQDMNPKGWVSSVIFKDPDTRRKGLTPKQKENIRKFVSEVYTAPGFLGWYMADEPEGRDNNPLWYEEAYQIIREIDPYHPCFMLNYGIEGIRRYYKSADILMPDCYPQYFEDGTTGKHRWCSSEWAKVSTSLRPAWQMPLATLWPEGTLEKKGVPADFHDQRSEIFQALIHNVKGFNLYAWHNSQKYSEFIIGPDENGKTLLLLKDYLLQNSTPNGITAKTTPEFQYFQAGLKEYKGQLCAIAVNTSVKKLNVEFRMIRRFNGKLFVAGEHRFVTVKNGVFTDSFEPKVTHIYLTDQQLSKQVPGVQETVQQIARHKANRKKPGNLVGVGQLLDIEYQELYKGRIPADYPRIQASSNWRFHSTMKMPSLYFLFDGLTEIRRQEFSWSPLSSDRAPWIEITLPKLSKVRQVKLYTPNANLIDCKVTVDSGKSVAVQKNKSKVITLDFPGEMTRKIRIDFQKYKKLTGEISGRLLTEIEVY